MNSLTHIAKFSTGMFPFTYSGSRSEAMSDQELDVVQGAKIVSAVAMSVSAVIDAADISRNVYEAYISGGNALDVTNLSQDLAFLAVSVFWAGANVRWVKRHATVSN